MSENCPEVETLERKLKRWNIREAMNVDCATRTSVKSCGNMSADNNDHMTGDEEIDGDYITYLNAYDSDIDSASDEDYALFLEGYDSDNHSPGDNSVCTSNIDVNTGYNNINDDDCYSDYSYLMSNWHDHIRYEGKEEEGEEERFCNKQLDTTMSKDLNVEYDAVDEDYALFLNSGSNKMSKDLNVDEDYALFLNSGTASMDGDNLANTDNGLIGKSSRIRQNSQVSDKAFYTHKVQCGFDEDYQEILNSPGNLEYMSDKITTKTSNVEDGSKTPKSFDTCEVQCDSDEDSRAFLNSASDLLYRPDKDTAKTSKVEDGSNSSDSDLIVLGKRPLCENTPFVSSKTYDSSFFEKEGNPRDGRGSYADDHSPFRRRLMECLEKPYDQQEYVEFLEELIHQKQKERHLDFRKVVKSCRTKELSKSYLELYPDLLKAIAELKDERPKVLFLLRGFFFWLKNLPHEGVFRPWEDETCLETLRKL